jgi:tRNA(fMet)-specific endonuclease VapC
VTYLFDTNAISALVHQRQDFQRLAVRVEAIDIEERMLSAITLSELQTMIAKAREPATKAAKVGLILAYFNVVDFGEAAALHVGQIRAHLEPRGLAIGPLDTLIAAHARSLNAVVITDNLNEFSRVPGLKVEGWRSER